MTYVVDDVKAFYSFFHAKCWGQTFVSNVVRISPDTVFGLLRSFAFHVRHSHVECLAGLFSDRQVTHIIC